jgi:S-adenosylmethionine:tRNA ribosyltransferase-isomerase
VRGLDADALTVMDEHGEVPLPPYIHTALADADRYQTVFAEHPGSTAAPTAGLHLTPAVLDAAVAAGARVATVDLAIGLDTFRPIQTDEVEDHPMHAERYRVPGASWDAVQAAERVVAVGTTVVRTLESVAATGELEGRTDLFLRGNAQFAVVDALLTNFHLPRTTLLALIDAFIGPRWRELYAAALATGYRFLSFGDAMFLPERTRRAG